MQMDNLLQLINAHAIQLEMYFRHCVTHRYPVAFYRLPGDNTIKVVAQKTGKLNVLHRGSEYIYEQGFIFAPFYETEMFPKLLIKPDIFTTIDKLPPFPIEVKVEQDNLLLPLSATIKRTTKEEFKVYIKNIVKQIKTGRFEKVVAARVVKKNKQEDFSPVQFFLEACKKYPATFASLVFTPQSGIWVGASPELLLEFDGNNFSTYSLAGTKNKTAWNERTAWGDKEMNEQKIVTDYIVKAFEGLSKTAPVIDGPETVTAGNLLHLRTTFKYAGMPHFNWVKAVDNLHPTPAVGGIPKQDAINYILKKEKTPRAYYSGYLGPVNLEESVRLYVNLRCMQVLHNKLAIYVGCGVTKDSKPANEWRETKLKSLTLGNLLTTTAKP